MKCPFCGHDLAPGAKFCPKCGNAIPVQGNVPQQPMYQQMPPQGYPQQPGYPPMYGVPMQKPEVPGKGFGIAGMVLGIVSVVFVCFLPFIGLVLGIVGLALSGVGMSKAKKVGMSNGMAVAGLTCSCVSVGINIIAMIIIGDAVGSVLSYL